MTDLIPLEEHNRKRQQSYCREPTPNGISCPECGAELLDSNPDIVLTTYPARYSIHCSSCEYHGYRL